MLLAGYNLIDGFAARFAALGVMRYGRRPLLAAVGVLPIVAYLGMAWFFGWGGILFGFLFRVGRAWARCCSSDRSTNGSFCLLRPLVGYGIDAWGLPAVLSALGALFSIVFVALLLPLVLRDTALIPRRSRSLHHDSPDHSVYGSVQRDRRGPA